MDALCTWDRRLVNFPSTKRESYSKLSGSLWTPHLLAFASFNSHLSDLSPPSLFCVALPHLLYHDGVERPAAAAVWPIACVSPREGGNLEVQWALWPTKYRPWGIWGATEL